MKLLCSHTAAVAVAVALVEPFETYLDLFSRFYLYTNMTCAISAIGFLFVIRTIATAAIATTSSSRGTAAISISAVFYLIQDGGQN